MKFRFWGCRGSVASPLSPAAFKAKVSAIVQRVRPEDLESPESRERFLARLPEALFGHIGGNTTCFEVETETQDRLLVDAGTGLVEFGRSPTSGVRSGTHYHILLTHFHWDHLQGIPFFDGFSHAENTVTFYSPVRGFETYLRDQMREPYFPVPMSIFPAKIEFRELDGNSLRIGKIDVSWKPVHHPGSCISYRFDDGTSRVVFSTDTELRSSDFVKDAENLGHYGHADALILDAQYTLGEAVDRMEWGHSSSSMAVDFALEFGAKRLYLFHHDPGHDDNRIAEIGRIAQWYSDHKHHGKLSVVLAREGRTEETP